jgi:hypothetical protein
LWSAAPRWRTAAAGAFLFLLNAYIALRLFRIGFHQHMNSVEGLFIAITRFAIKHPHDLTWLPLWYLGMPFHQVYPPGIHVSAAWLAMLTGWDPARAWHFTVALVYSLGPALLFWTAWRMSERFFTSFAAGLLWSVFSPSCLLVPSIWHDTGEMISNRRLHNIVAWGEGPNAVTLGLVVLALGFLHLAVTRGKPVHYVGAAITAALVPLCSWPAFAAMLIAIACYVLSREPKDWMRIVGKMSVIGVFAYSAVAAWLPPSTVRATYLRSRVMMGTPRPGLGREYAAGGMILVLLALWILFRRFGAPFWFRFAVFYMTITAWIALLAFYGGPQLVTQAQRFHLAMEIGIILTLSFGVSLLIEGRRRLQYAVAALLLAFVVRQTVVARRHARRDLEPQNIASTFEYRTAEWLDQHTDRERVFAMGSVSFWMNVFTDTPQLSGCCDQANTSWMNDVAGYIIPSGDGTTQQNDLETRTLWLKAFGVHAIAIGGPKTRDAYPTAFAKPYSLIEGLPVMERDGDDYILEVPSRSHTLGHVMRPADLPSRLPDSGIDTAPIKQYVDALENPAYPLVEEQWPNPHTAILRASLEPGEILSFQMTYWPGWHATAGGRPAAVKRDTFGFLYVEPDCSGECTVQLTWDGGIEASVLDWLRWAALLGAVLLGVLLWRRRSEPVSAS